MSTTTPTDPVDLIRRLPPDKRAEVLDRLPPKALQFVYDSMPEITIGDTPKPTYPWQSPPHDNWFGWIINGGRGIGKTLGGAHYIDKLANNRPKSRGGIVAPTLQDARATCVEGETGLLAVNPRIKFNRSTLELTWPNGSHARCFGAYTPDDRERLRGPKWHWAWLEEFGAWRQLDEDDDEKLDAWQHIIVGCLQLGNDPRFVMGTTPRNRLRLKQVMARSDTVSTFGTTYEATGLAESVRQRLIDSFEGTRLARQELLGEMLEDVEGALWTGALLEKCRTYTIPELKRIVVAVDPSGGGGDEQGIIVAGLGVDGHAYILSDYSCNLPPLAWGKRAVQAYIDFNADCILWEANFGGDMVQSNIKSASHELLQNPPPLKKVTASKGKQLRAQPIASLYGDPENIDKSIPRVHHPIHAQLATLEDQMTTWTPNDTDSPDRLDAMVMAVTDLMLGKKTSWRPVGS